MFISGSQAPAVPHRDHRATRRCFPPPLLGRTS